MAEVTLKYKEIERKERILQSIAARERSIKKKLKNEGEFKNPVFVVFSLYQIGVISKFSLVLEKGSCTSEALEQLKDEVKALRHIFSFPQEVYSQIDKYYVEALYDSLDVMHAARQLVSLFPENRDVTELLVKNLLRFMESCIGFIPQQVLLLKKIALELAVDEYRFKCLLKEHIIPEKQDPFNILGVAEDVSYAELRKTYRLAVKQWHPDRFGVDEPLKELVDAAQEKFYRIQHAFKVIKRQRGFDSDR